MCEQRPMYLILYILIANSSTIIPNNKSFAVNSHNTRTKNPFLCCYVYAGVPKSESQVQWTAQVMPVVSYIQQAVYDYFQKEKMITFRKSKKDVPIGKDMSICTVSSWCAFLLKRWNSQLWTSISFLLRKSTVLTQHCLQVVERCKFQFYFVQQAQMFAKSYPS